MYDAYDKVLLEPLEVVTWLERFVVNVEWDKYDDVDEGGCGLLC